MRVPFKNFVAVRKAIDFTAKIFSFLNNEKKENIMKPRKDSPSSNTSLCLMSKLKMRQYRISYKFFSKGHSY